MFYLSLATLVLGIVIGLYLFLEWFRHGRRYPFPLLWAIGLFALYWFQVPFILAHAGVRFTVTDFNLFYALTFPATFGGLALVYLGILSVLRPPTARKTKFFLLLWFVVCLVVFFYYFIVRGGMITDHVLVFVVNLLFFAPLRLLILYALWKWIRLQNWERSRFTLAGIAFMMGWALMGVVGNIAAVERLLRYPAGFWFIALSDFSLLCALQAVSMALLVSGFLLVHRACFRNLNKGLC